MRKISIVGGGQCGLQIALGLVQKGYEITLINDRTPEEVYRGNIMSSQSMFHTALQNERDIGINYWEDQTPIVEGVQFSIANEQGGRDIHWIAKLDNYNQSVDQRVKFSGWMEKLTELGGSLEIKQASIADVDALTASSDLVLVASGKGENGRIFERDDEKSEFDKPQRALALSYVKNMEPYPDFHRVSFNVIPGVGEYFVFPALTIDGMECEIMVMEGLPGGPMDECWHDADTPEKHLAASKWIVDTYLPWESARCKNIELTDDNGILKGRFPPTIRKPVVRLPSGRIAMGIGDAIVLNDPLTGQGSNNASKCAKVVYDAILANADKEFDEQWMQQTFDEYWDYVRWCADWTNTLLRPPTPSTQNILKAANDYQEMADLFANGFDNSRDYDPWFFDGAEADKLIAAFRDGATRTELGLQNH
jgi:hypothetical protein